MRRAPFWAQALALCALFAIVGVAALDDYGVTGDDIYQRRIAIANADYIATGNDDGLYNRVYRYYGVVFDMPLLMAERALGLQDSRHIYLMRHLLTHLFFIAGGFACGMLAYRTLGSRWVALLAMLLFLLHPRLYAHSFFNVKDVPFAALLLIVLYLVHRAFRKDTLGAFLLCGIGAGLAINLRPFGLMLPPMILAMRALDLWQAGREDRKRVLSSAGIFAAAALAMAYITHPYYWENPLRFVEVIRELSQHPTILRNLFMGELYRSDAVPWNYIPVWFAITAPPLPLSLGVLGAAVVCWQATTRPLDALRDRETRFRVLLIGCVVSPIAIAIALQSTLYGGWRHMYFLWGPFCLLAAVGLHYIANNSAWDWAVLRIAARLPGRVSGVGMRRALAYGGVGVGLITTLTAMAALHPYEYVYFNALVDTKTPGALGNRYDMDYYRMAQRQSLEYLLARYPEDVLRVRMKNSNGAILPQNDSERILKAKNLNSADYVIRPFLNSRNVSNEPMLHRIEAYGSVIAYIFAPKNAAAYRAAYDEVPANGTLVARADFDIYIHNGALHYLSANCEPLTSNDIDLRIFLHIIPIDRLDLPSDMRGRGFENADFRFNSDAAFFDGKCINIRRLPDYPIARIATGYERDGVDWSADINMVAQALYDSIAAGDYGQPVAQSDFDVHMRGDGLAYIKEPCAADDTDARFFLHIFPADLSDLPADMRERGFENRDFQFIDQGAYAGYNCVAERELPDYPIERIRTGQFVSGEGRVWSAEFPAAQ